MVGMPRSPTICHLQAGDLGKPTVQFSPNPENQGSHWTKSQSLKVGKQGAMKFQGRKRWPSELKRRVGSAFPSPDSSGPFMGCMMPTLIAEGLSLYLVYWCKCKHPSQMPHRHTQLSGPTLTQSSQHINITITSILKADNLLLGFTSSQMKRNLAQDEWYLESHPYLDDMWMRF